MPQTRAARRRKSTSSANQSPSSSTQVNLVCYNVLSSHLCDPKYFTGSSKENLDEKTRFDRLWTIIEEEMESNAPIFCFQEVSVTWAGRLQSRFHHTQYTFISRHYGNAFDNYMGSAVAIPTEYDIQRVDMSRISDTRRWKRGPKPTKAKKWLDALMYPIFLLIAMFTALKRALGLIKRAPFGALREGETFFGATKERWNCAVTVHLQDRSSSQEFVVSTYHMPCRFLAPKMMNMHAALWFAHVHRFAEGLPFVLAGDFNAQPDSSLYELMTTGTLPKTHPEYPQPMPSYDPWEIADLPALRSAYVQVLGEEPAFTNWNETRNEEFFACLDYIFVSDEWDVRSVRELPSSKEEADGPWPSASEPSDHTRLSAILELSEG